VEVLRFGQAAPQARFRLRAPWSRFAALEADLLRQVLECLGYTSAAAARPRPIVLAARHNFILGKEAYLRGAYETAIEQAAEAIKIEPEYVEAIGLKGVCLARLGRYAEAETEHQQQVALAAQVGDRRWHIEALANLGSMNYFAGNYERADEYLGRAAALAEELGLVLDSAQISNNRGFVLFRLGRLGEAERAFGRAIEIHSSFGGLSSLVGPRNGMGNVLCEQGRFAEARQHYHEALALAARVGDRTSMGTTHMHLGRCAALAGEFNEAQQEFALAFNTLEETRFWNGLTRAYEYAADMHVAMGKFDDAVHCADKRIELAHEYANARAEAAAWEQKALVLRQAGQETAALGCEKEARRMASPRAA
jgi:tetratricopeptide (TPR) repeat protein